jgi:type I restriction enzyme M protein
LFTGDAGSGESEIRRWLLEQDFVEGIIALSNDMFFNTGIGTYVWILSNKKADHRKGKVQLINLADVSTSMRKSEGTKRRYLSEEQIDDVVRLYDSFTESDTSKIFDTTDFAFRKVAIKRPLRGKLVVNEESIVRIREGKQFQKLSEEQRNAWISYLEDRNGEHEYDWAQGLVNRLKNTGNIGKTTKALGNEFTNTFFQQDPKGDIVTDSKGNPISDTSLNDSESVPFKQDVETYFEEEVLPHLPDAFIDYSIRDEKDGDVGIVGYEINFNRYFYIYIPPRSLQDIDSDLKASEARIQALLDEVAE